MESDSGNFVTTGFGFTGVPAAQEIITEIGSVLLSSIGAGIVSDLRSLLIFKEISRKEVQMLIMEF